MPRGSRIPFTEWWTNTVIKDSDAKEFSRKDLILALCNKEGGAHVDPEIEAAYEKLASSESFGWVYQEGDGPDQLLPNPVVHSMRQISYEVLESLKQQRERLSLKVSASRPQ